MTERPPSPSADRLHGAASKQEQANAPAVASESRHQFRLVHLFVLTTLSAIAAAVFAARGQGTLPMSICLIVAWLNACGAFRAVQSGRGQVAVLGLAWVMFLVSLGLPSIVVFGPVQGWGAAWLVLQAPIDAVWQGKAWHLPQLLWYLLIDMANVLAIVLPLLVWRLRRGGGSWLSAALCVALVAPPSVAWDMPVMLIGYYVWCGSFLLMLVALPISRRTMAAMVALATVLVIAAMWHEIPWDVLPDLPWDAEEPI